MAPLVHRRLVYCLGEQTKRKLRADFYLVEKLNSNYKAILGMYVGIVYDDLYSPWCTYISM